MRLEALRGCIRFLSRLYALGSMMFVRVVLSTTAAACLWVSAISFVSEIGGIFLSSRP